MHHLVPLVRRGLLIGRRWCLRRFLQVRDIGKVILLGHTNGQSQDHQLPLTGAPCRDWPESAPQLRLPYSERPLLPRGSPGPPWGRLVCPHPHPHRCRYLPLLSRQPRLPQAVRVQCVIVPNFGMWWGGGRDRGPAVG
ncbi:hypothetical protein EYF80_002759 [Liparis tanakae]|uniref:Uncharacterized protein n=1 Tax=Liparis tanakae TaxID=230148 RepID=A0A4Z2JAY9_9TELE|nr:hypothetical protein EYF80_002759 [Liparis tanakae]